VSTMSSAIYLNLSWLPQSPPDFAAQCRSLMESPDGFGKRIQALASYSLDGNQLNRLAKVVEKARAADYPFAPLTPFRLGLLSNSTVDFIVPALTASAARYGIALECTQGNYNQVVQEALQPNSAFYRANPDAVLIAVDFRGLPLRVVPGRDDEAQVPEQAALEHFRTIRSGVKTNSKAICILQTVPAAAESLFGSLDRVLPGTTYSVINAVNRGIADSILGSEDVLLDVAHLAETVGLAEWHSPAQWNMAKLPFSNSSVPLYADHVSRIIAALRGKSRRCLILDLDNTLWGGVIGDDGLEGIRVAQGDATGEAYLSVQRLALALRERGIVLAVCSKNQDEVARLPFRRHPEMMLRENHFAVFQANWNDKATNIQAIADELSLGLESIVFLDDNPAERALVRKLLPQVAVPELPTDPALYARTLSAAGYFESVGFSDEDLKRADFYQDNARRVTLQKQVGGDLEAYLASLRMEITFQPFDRTGRARITQLINKSNQFNLTTRRYTEAEVAEAERDPNCFTLQVRLSDIFGDNGMISVVICRRLSDSEWEIDTWIMSCRVLGRRVENMVLRQILDHAGRHRVSKLIGIYRPTERNKLVEQHYLKLGFTQTAQKADGTTDWELFVENASAEGAPMLVRSVGFAMAEL
jgi:FkbH-like protein